MSNEEEQLRLKLFLEANADLPLISETGVRMHFFVRSGQIEQAILIDDHVTSIAHVSKVWWLVSEWKERLLAFQGPQFGSKSALIDSIWQDKKDGYSPNVIANSINETLTLYIKNVVRDLTQMELDQARLPDEEFRREWSIRGRMTHSFLREVIRTLDGFGIKDDEAIVYIDDALERASNGLAPFLPDQPITGERVRERIRTWDKRRKALAKFARLPSEDE
ncbi:MAG: hypothetical protein KF893_01325 [Caldilineaceae bacterium]|nr:hypothetical protein [Caldilineaceae bacterium]